MKDLTDSKIDSIFEEWWSLLLSTDLPRLEEGIKIDEWWLKVLDFKRLSGTPLYSCLSQLIKILLILPCDQAPVERVFSMVNKIHTKYRPTLQNSSVCALLTCKVNSTLPCHKMVISDDLVSQVKSAATRRNNYLKDHAEEQ